MSWFIKHETFTPQTAELSLEQRRPYLEAHRAWVDQESAAGRRIRSGFWWMHSVAPVAAGC